jgi:Poxvirus A32 protein
MAPELQPQPPSKKKKLPPLKGLLNENPHITAIVGKKNSGKSHLLCNLLRDPRGYKKKYTRVLFVSPTFRAQFDSLWKALDPEGIQVYEDVSNRLLETIVQEQTEDPAPTLLIFDDIADALKSQVDQSTLNRLVANSRHLGLSIVVLSQKVTMLPTVLRSQVDCWICYSACSYIELEALHREMSVLPRKEFLATFREATKAPYSFLCVSIVNGKIELNSNFQ